MFGKDVSPADTVARLEEMITVGILGGQATALITDAGRSYPHPPDQVPANEHTLRSLRWRAGEKAIFGIEVPQADTLARLETMIADGLNQQAAQTLQRSSWNAKPYPTGKSPLPLHLVEGIDGLTISEGHYAVLVEGVLRFYRVYTPGTGEFKNVVVMRRFAGESLLALYPGEAKNALTLIDADPDVAAFRFADEFTLCWVCGKRLTDAVSRLLSVGPVCRGFHNHSGLRHAATEVDADPTRRQVYRALRTWSIDRGFVDPRTREQRKEMVGQMTASRLASAWSGLPGILTLGTAAEVVALVDAAHAGNNATLAEPVRDALLAAPADTLAILLGSGILAGCVLQVLTQHPNHNVRQAAGEFFLSLLGG